MNVNYRIVRDVCNGYEVQFLTKKGWEQCGKGPNGAGINSEATIYEAKRYAQQHCNRMALKDETILELSLQPKKPFSFRRWFKSFLRTSSVQAPPSPDNKNKENQT